MNQECYNVSINLGTYCNFKCTYCFESLSTLKKNVINDDVINHSIELIDKLLQHYKVNIEFWGGEPFLYMNVIQKFFTYYTNHYNENISFFIYTNGLLVTNYKDYLLSIDNRLKNKIDFQISYDFLDNDNNKRIPKGMTIEQSNILIMKSIHFLDNNDFNFDIKTTGTLYDIENNIFNQYVNFHKLNQTLKKNITLLYTPDSMNTKYPNEQKINTQFVKLIRYFLKNKLTKTNFQWFDSDVRANCHGGDHSFIIDTNGDVLYCHGCLYINNCVYTNIFNDNCLYDIEHNYLIMNNKFEPNEQCMKCDSLLCFRCNAMVSKGNVNEWDNSNNENVCLLYKLISKYIRTFRDIRGVVKWE